MRFRPYRPEILPDELAPLIGVLQFAIKENALTELESNAANRLLNRLNKIKEKEDFERWINEN